MKVSTLIKEARRLLIEPLKTEKTQWKWVILHNAKMYAIKGGIVGKVAYYWHHDGNVYFQEPSKNVKTPPGHEWIPNVNIHTLTPLGDKLNRVAK